MKHIANITTRRPAPAQFELALGFVGLLSALLSLMSQLQTLFGVDLTKEA